MTLAPCRACRRHIAIDAIACVFCAAVAACSPKKDEPKPAPAPAPVVAPADSAAAPTPTPALASDDAGVADGGVGDAAAADAGAPADAAVPGSVQKHGVRHKINKSEINEERGQHHVVRPPKPYGAPPARSRIV